MLIHKKISEYLVFETETILKALEKISSNQKRIAFVVAEDGRLLGSLSDGDIRRWIMGHNGLNLNLEVNRAMNRHVISRNVNTARNELESAFTAAIDCLPLLDDRGRLIAVAAAREKGMAIGRHVISDNSPAFIIAEIGNNHNGSAALAKDLIRLAHDAGADCAKFQMRDLTSLYKSGGALDNSGDLGSQYTLDILNKFQLSDTELFEAFDYCKSLGLPPLCTPWDLSSLRKLESYGMEAYKVSSADFTNHELLGVLAATGKPLICSTGMSTEAEVRTSVEFLRKHGAEFMLLHCNSTYPTPYKDVNLSYLTRLKELSGTLVGYSGHERGTFVPLAAVTLGAKVIEKHFTLDKTMEGNDHKVSLMPDEFRRMVNEIRQLEEAMGSPTPRTISQGELINRETLAKSLVAVKAIREGEIILRDDVEIKSPGQGLQPMYLDALVGRAATRDIDRGDFFFPSDLRDTVSGVRKYKFDRPFGIPVRYHDYVKLASGTNLDFVEFHLSYRDMEVAIDDFIQGQQDISFAVHSPELFSGDHILDLSSSNGAYLSRSLRELDKVCSVTRQLKKYFPRTERPLIVVNAGGFDPVGFIPHSEKIVKYARVAESLSMIDGGGVEIVLQTMPPFPWHFGGQSHHNLFIDPNEIADFCRKYKYRICYDVSHSMMACNYFKWNLSDFTRIVGPYVAHIHVVDAQGVDGEGVQIGAGDVDFKELGEGLKRWAPGAQFLPEVWQGHKNKGEGFWHALDYLEKFL